MAKIKILDELLASKIAAGEVVERPASVVKELMENALDAGATSISVHIIEGGKRLIRIVDNGHGISKEDAPLAFYRHATSKISSEDDLYSIRTMGFRGEALSSISSIARVTLKTRRPEDISGTMVVIEGSTTPEVSEDGTPEGTSIEVKDLFFNTPARLKFLRSNESEYGKILDVFKKIALINPDKRFKIIHGSGRALETAPGTLKQRIADLFGIEVIKSLIEVKSPHLTGFISSPDLTFPTSKGIYTYVNGRAIRDKGVNRAIIDGYGSIIDSRYPFAVLDLIIPFEDVDVNIHPTKSEVRFKNTRFIYDSVKYAIRGALSTGLLPSKAAPSISYSSRPVYGNNLSYPVSQSKESFAAETAPFYFDEPVERRLEFHRDTEEVKNPELLELDTIGQVWGEFLLAQSKANGGELYLIDQHGAAERSAFERLKKQFMEAKIKRQMLLLPERIETTPEERDSINESMDYLDRLGFEIMPFGPSIKTGGETFLLKSVPDLLSAKSCGTLIRDLAEELSSVGGSSRVEDRIEEALMRIACHSVIRGPRPLTREEGNALIREMVKIDFAGHCPHGRPVIKKFTRSEIEVMFKR
ncbi:MAG: DNA mismatch repair endonuclease MutL [Deltaproteobacteria bacterium]|nr:DNA mismatch repair endonuclease MutL [Deltaproteobacteria bacterium]